MFVGAAACALLCLALALFGVKGEFGREAAGVGLSNFLGRGVLFASMVILAMMIGAWFGSTISALWMSAKGKCLYCVVSGGSLGGVSATAAATRWIVRDPAASITMTIPTTMAIVGVAVLTGTLTGLFFGYILGRPSQTARHRLADEDE
jgi:hypothetical protein